MSTVPGVVLTGGASRRMGTDKALLMIDDRPLAVRVADALWEAGCHPVWCQGGDIAMLETIGLGAVADDRPGDGPVTAILSALRHADGDVVVAACDLVDLTSDAVRAVIDVGTAGESGHRVAVATADGRGHLLSYWPASARDPLEQLVDDGVRSYTAALERLQASEAAVAPAALRNVNHPSDLD